MVGVLFPLPSRWLGLALKNGLKLSNEHIQQCVFGARTTLRSCDAGYFSFADIKGYHPMNSKKRNSVNTYSIRGPILIGLISLLWGCADDRPDGQIYMMNGAGMTLPAAGVELALLPGASRADFFYEPIKEAYAYATADLNTTLVPPCDEAIEIIGEFQQSLDQELQELQGSGTVPETPEACFNMCTQRVDLENQREQDREELNQTISRLNTEIAAIKSDVKGLQASRSEKAGVVGKRLEQLTSSRNRSLNARAKGLLSEQIGKIKFNMGGQLRGYDQGKKVPVILVNNTDYAILKKQYGSRKLKTAGYYQGKKIIETESMLPRFNDRETLYDDLGFDKGYLVAPGGRVYIGDESVSDPTGLNLNSPSGRLLAKENGWTPNDAGYILPDEIRLVDFPASLFVIPDEKGRREGSQIVYSPKPVDFRSIAERQGLPEDAEIARLTRQMQNQSFPEDTQINEKQNLIAGLEKQKKQATNNFNNSAVANQINALGSSESACRLARDAFNSLNQGADALGDLRNDLASCQSGSLEAATVFSAIASLNSTYDTYIELPDISSRYQTKAGELIFSKLAQASETTIRTGMDGSFYLDGSIDENNTLLFAEWNTSFGEAFWLQPLGSLGEKKDLSHVTAQNDSFEEYLEGVVRFGANVSSVEALRLFTDFENNPSMQALFESYRDSATEALNEIEERRSEQESSAEPDAATQPPLQCEA